MAMAELSVTGSIRSNEEITMRKIAIALLWALERVYGQRKCATSYTSNE